MSKLVLFLADGTTLDIPLDRARTAIGRRAGNEICLPYAAVSGMHAVVVTTAAGSVLEDLGSTNGTTVNDQRIAKHPLRDGDRIDIGRQQLIYLADANAVVPSVPRQRGWAGRRALGTQTVPAPATGEPGVAVALGESMPVAGDNRAGALTLAPWRLPPGPTIRVLTGPNAGRSLPLTKDESLIGRVGSQVAAVRRSGDRFRLVPVEGAVPTRLNGSEVSPEGRTLQPGDAIEVAGVGLEFLVPEEAPAS